MKKGFKETNPVPKEKKINSPFNFDCPPYDQRTGCYANAGAHYGVGKKQPVGHSGNPKMQGVPMGDVNTMEVDCVPYKNEKIDIVE